MTVCRQVMSLTTPVVPWMRTRSPGWITLPSMSPNPLMMFAIVSCIPREIATPPTPSAARMVVGLTPNTGCSTMVIAAAQMITRRILAKIDAFGMLARPNTSLVTRTTTLVAIMAIAITITSRMTLPACCCSQSVITSIARPIPVMRSASTAASRLVWFHPTDRGWKDTACAGCRRKRRSCFDAEILGSIRRHCVHVHASMNAVRKKDVDICGDKRCIRTGSDAP